MTAIRTLLLAIPIAMSAIAPSWSVAPKSPASPKSPVEYRISLENRAHHEARVVATFRDLGKEPLELVISRSSPGRYALHEFAKNIYDVAVVDDAGRALAAIRSSPYQWTVATHDGTVVFGYTVYGDLCDGTYNAIDLSHAHLNAPATFVWARGQEARPVRVLVDPVPGWRVATQLPEGSADGSLAARESFAARDLQHFFDSPLEIGEHWVREWPMGSGTLPSGSGTLPSASATPAASAAPAGQRVRIALHHQASTEHADVLADLTAAIVDEEIAVFGEPPTFDDGVYTFLLDLLPWCAGDGMEHRNSTVITRGSSLEDDFVPPLSTIAHEFFHAWSIERLRPRSLEPFDFERANQAGELWFGEGVTSYYANLILKRAGIVSLDRFASRLSEGLSGVVTAPGRRHGSAIEMSELAPFVDAASWTDPTNSDNTFLSYYAFGSVLGLALDLELRQRAPLGLDGVMALAWRRRGREETPYTDADLREVVAEVAEDPDFAEQFFDRYVAGRELPDFRRLLLPAGLVLRQARPGMAWMGPLSFSYVDGAVVLDEGTIEGTPLYVAGLDRGDRIASFDGQAIGAEDDLRSWLEKRRPGERVGLEVHQRGRDRTLQLVLAEDPALEVIPFEHLERPISPEILSFRDAWLGAKSGHRLERGRRCPVCRRHFAAEQEFCPWDGEALHFVIPARSE